MPRTFTPTLTLPLRGRGLSRGRSSIFPSPSGGGLGWGRICSLAAVLLLLAVVVSCGGSDVIVPPTEEFGGPEFAAVVVNSDLGVGRERIAFGVVRRDGPPLEADSVTVRTYYLPANSEARELRETLTGEYEPWPFLGGVFVIHPELDTVGAWELETEFTSSDGLAVTAKSAFLVKEASATPAIGAAAPASVTARASDVPDLSHITTDPDPDPLLYELSLHEAISASKPLVVLFATPAYCITATCGPLVEDLSGMREEFAGRANFVHVEVYKDPHRFESGQRPGRDDVVVAVKEWNLPTEPWTFVVDAGGRVHAKFESYAPPATISASLRELLN